MHIEWTGRNIELTAALKRQIEDRLEQAVRPLEDVLDAHVVLSVEKHRHVADIAVRCKRVTLTGTASSKDMYQSIARAADHIETRVQKKRAKQRTSKRRAPRTPDSTRSLGEASSTDDDRAVEVIEEKLDRVKPITHEDAVLLLEKARRPFVMFRSAATGRIATLYRRSDGRFGMIEPKP